MNTMTYDEYRVVAHREIDEGNYDLAKRYLDKLLEWDAENAYDFYKLAEDMHTAFCSHNHDDMCGWGWENGENKWDQGVHRSYLMKANQAADKFPDKPLYELVPFLKAVRGLTR